MTSCLTLRFSFRAAPAYVQPSSLQRSDNELRVKIQFAGRRMRSYTWFGCLVATGLAGCSHYPIPDDVSLFRTEDIVRYARCEMKFAIREDMATFGSHVKGEQLIPLEWDESRIEKEIDAAIGRLKHNKPKKTDETLVRLVRVAAVYTFDFNITEHNTTGGGAGFKMPWAANMLDVGASAALDLTRQGLRVIGTEDTWGGLITNRDICKHVSPGRPINLIHPLTGSIGVEAVVKTFLDIEKQRGAKDNFVDTLTFTTQASGAADASVKLEPVPNQFRVVSASFGLSASRVDIHKLTISLTFPRKGDPQPITDVKRSDGDLNAPFTRPAEWRARYNLCVADARARENAFRMLRLEAPEVYCVKYADAFSPQTGLLAQQPIIVQMEQTQVEQRPPPAPRATAPGARAPAAAERQGGGAKPFDGSPGPADPAPPAPGAAPPPPPPPPRTRRAPQFVPQLIRPNAPI